MTPTISPRCSHGPNSPLPDACSSYMWYLGRVTSRALGQATHEGREGRDVRNCTTLLLSMCSSTSR